MLTRNSVSSRIHQEYLARCYMQIYNTRRENKNSIETRIDSNLIDPSDYIERDLKMIFQFR